MIEGLLQSGLAKVKSMHQVDSFGNSPGVYRKLTEGIKSLPGWRKGVRQKKIETHRKIVRGSRKACQESGCSDNMVGSRRKFARRFVEGIEKLVGNVKGDRWKEDWRTCRKIAGGCHSIRETRAAASSFRQVKRPYPGSAEPPKSADKSLVLRMTSKFPIGESPFSLAFGTEMVLPPEVVYPI
ncbi:hypothetical protein BHM03_00032606 [Ensete ventricosum]|nr:hypothetical protein BHM03_00032606 [Ensete ventricosum]